ncbi:MAG: polyphosphate polymerase domain-containing protein [Sedimentisphaerales bacterium]|nr:polyphosphate polymerase domain-containing protein [Sedimentisphaerales bacterium]
MFKDLLKRHKKAAPDNGPVKRQPPKAHVSGSETTRGESSSASVPSVEIESHSKGTIEPLRDKIKITLMPSVCPPPKKGDLFSCRYELKYRISESKAQTIKAYVQNFLPMDRYAQQHPDGQYPISSLYLDSDNLDLCRETLLGKANRFKLRIRSYDDGPESPVFLEIKRRANKIILKSRARINRSDLLFVLEGRDRNPARSDKDQESLEQFVYYKQMIQGHPVVLVRYLREPFEGDTENRVRITFDRHLCYREMSDWQIALNGEGWRRIPIPFVILEIKFTGHYPAWLNEMVHVFNLNRSSMSKYVTSIKQSQQTALRKALPYYLD